MPTPLHTKAGYVTVVANFLLAWTETALFLRIIMCLCIFSVSDMLYLWDCICVHEFLLSIYYKVGMLWVQGIQYTVLSRLKFAIWWKIYELKKWYKGSKFTQQSGRITEDCQMQNRALKSFRFFQAVLWESWPIPSFFVKRKQMCISGIWKEESA